MRTLPLVALWGFFALALGAAPLHAAPGESAASSSNDPPAPASKNEPVHDEVSVPSGTPSEVFAACNQLYDRGEYPSASQCYQSLVEEGIGNGHLYYNLGNARYRLGMLGEALLAWNHARIYLPRDADLLQNMATARQQRVDHLEEGPPPSPLRRALLFWIDDLAPGELWWLAGVISALCWGAVLLRLHRPEPRWTILAGVGLVLSGSLLSGAFYKARVLTTSPQAVVLAPEAVVRSGRDVASADLFRLHEGAEGRVSAQEGGWLLLELPDGKRGWVDGATVGVVKW